MYIADSSFFVAVFIEKDAFHHISFRTLSDCELQNQKIHISYRVIEEVATVLMYKHFQQSVENFFNYIFSSSIIHIIDNDFFEEIRFFQDNGIKNKLSFVDSCVIYQSLEKKLDILSYDKKQLKVAKNFNKLP